MTLQLMETGANNNNHSLFDHAAFKKYDTVNLELSVQLSQNELSFCIKNDFEVIAIQNITAPNYEIFEIIKNNSWLNKKYQSVNISLINKLHTLVPTTIFEEKNEKNYLSFNHRIDDNIEIVSDKLKNIDAYNVYGITKAEQEIINTFFQKAHIKHFGSCLIDLMLVKENINKHVFVSIKKNLLSILLINHNKLQLFNTFEFKSTEDCFYYIMFVLEQIKFDPKEVDFCFLDQISKNSKIYDLSYKFIKNIRFINNHRIKLSPNINDIPIHYYHSLIHQASCV